MITLDEIKFKVANENGYPSWSTLTQNLDNKDRFDEICTEVSLRYGNVMSREYLDMAAEKATAKYRYQSDEWGMNKSLVAYVVKSSILDLKPKRITKDKPALELPQAEGKPKYHFISFQGDNRDGTKQQWSQAVEGCPIAAIKNMEVVEANSERPSYRRFILLNSVEITEEQYGLYKEHFN